MRLLISGYSSTISVQLLAQLREVYSSLEIIQVGRDASADIYCDFSNFDSIKQMSEQCLDNIDLDAVFLNHGILLGKKALALNKTDINDYMMVNLFSVILILEKLCSRQFLNTVVMSSISAKEGSYDPIYAATKAGVDSFRYQANRLVPPNSRLNFVSPGIVSDAKMTTMRTDIENVEYARSKTPTNSLTISEEVASLVSMLLVSPGNINFQDIAINGGVSLNK